MSTNPFLVDSSCTQPSSAGTAVFNPFAAFAADTATSAAASNPFLHAFGTVGTADIGASEDATFISTASTAPNPFAQFFSTADPITPAPEPAIPDTLLLDDSLSTATEAPAENVVSSWAEPPAPTGPPRRPPPPRPSVAKETKDLILSVTGALEATSSDLLDRLQATRTPSPTPLRDLNSPSPTAMYEVNDLLGDDDIAPPPLHRHGVAMGASANIQQEASDIFDAIANLAKSETTSQMPPTSTTTAAPTIPFPVVPTSTMVTPAPPSRPPPPQLPIQGVETDLSTLLDSRLAMDRSSTTTGMPVLPIGSQLTVGGPRSMTELGVYTATRKASHDITATRLQPIPARKKYSLDYSATGVGAMPLVDTDSIRMATAPSPVAEDSAPPSTAGSSPLHEFPASVPPPLTARSPPQQPSTPSPPPPPPPISVESDRDRSDGGHILEAAKFPVMSTTPLMSYENIANESLYEDVEMVPAPAPAAPALDVFATSAAASTFDNDPFATAPLATSMSFATGANVDVGVNFGVPSAAEAEDEFDDFDQKFRNFSKTDVKTVTAADPFDPFSSTGVGIPGATNGENDLQGK